MRIPLSVEGGGGRARPPWPMAGPGAGTAKPPPPPFGRQEASPGDRRPPPTPPPPPTQARERAGWRPPPPPPHPPQLGSHRRGPPPPQGWGGAPTHRRNGDTVGATAAGPAPANPHRRAGATRTTEYEGGRAPHDPPVTTARSEGTEGGFAGQLGPPGERSPGRPSPPPHPGAALQPRPHARAGRERASDTKRARKGYRRPPPGRRAGRPRRDTPPEARGMGPPHPLQPPAHMGAAKNERAHACARGRRTDRTRRSWVNTNRSGMGGHAPHGQHNASDARFVACPGKAEGRKEAERPPALQSVGDPAVLLSASYPCARQSAIQRTPPSPLPPCPDPVHVDWGLPARATRFTTHSPTLRTGFVADDTPKWRKRLPRPSSESVGLQSSSAGVRSRALVLLGSLHVELSSWRRGNHPPLQQLAPPPIPVDRVEVSFVLPPTQEKQNTWEPPTPAAVRTVTCTQTGRWEASSGIRRDRWETTDPGVRTSSFAARAWCATSGAAAF